MRCQASSSRHTAGWWHRRPQADSVVAERSRFVAGAREAHDRDRHPLRVRAVAARVLRQRRGPPLPAAGRCAADRERDSAAPSPRPGGHRAQVDRAGRAGAGNAWAHPDRARRRARPHRHARAPMADRGFRHLGIAGICGDARGDDDPVRQRARHDERRRDCSDSVFGDQQRGRDSSASGLAAEARGSSSTARCRYHRRARVLCVAHRRGLAQALRSTSSAAARYR